MAIRGPGIKKDDSQVVFERIRASWGILERRGRYVNLGDCTFLKTAFPWPGRRPFFNLD